MYYLRGSGDVEMRGKANAMLYYVSISKDKRSSAINLSVQNYSHKRVHAHTFLHYYQKDID